MFLSEWREFPSALWLQGKNNLMTASVSMLLKSRASLTCFRACFLPVLAKDITAPRFFTLSCTKKLLALCLCRNHCQFCCAVRRRLQCWQCCFILLFRFVHLRRFELPEIRHGGTSGYVQVDPNVPE